MIIISVVIEKFLKLELLNFLFSTSTVNMAENFNIPSVESELFHFLVRHDKLLISSASHMESSFTLVKVTLNTWALLFMANVAFHLESFIVEFSTVLLQPITNKNIKAYLVSSCSNHISLCQLTHVWCTHSLVYRSIIAPLKSGHRKQFGIGTAYLSWSSFPLSFSIIYLHLSQNHWASSGISSFS